MLLELAGDGPHRWSVSGCVKPRLVDETPSLPAVRLSHWPGQLPRTFSDAAHRVSVAGAVTPQHRARLDGGGDEQEVTSRRGCCASRAAVKRLRASAGVTSTMTRRRRAVGLTACRSRLWSLDDENDRSKRSSSAALSTRAHAGQGCPSHSSARASEACPDCTGEQRTGRRGLLHGLGRNMLMFESEGRPHRR